MGNFWDLVCSAAWVVARVKTQKLSSVKNAKMMFDEAQVFKGLLAWFSASVPKRLRSQWGKSTFWKIYVTGRFKSSETQELLARTMRNYRAKVYFKDVRAKFF